MYSISKFLISIICIGSTSLSAYANFANSMPLQHVPNYHFTYNMIKLKIEKVEYLIEKKGSDALPEIKALNKNANDRGVFVIDPVTGKILVSPDIKNVYDKNLLNGKILAKEAIKDYLDDKRDSMWSDIADAYSAKYKDFFTRVVVSPEGRVYVIAVGTNTLNMQRLFVSKIVNKACSVIKAFGIKASFKVFNKANGSFRYNSETYVFVYDINGTCLFNPNYSELVGENILDSNIKESKDVKEMIQIAKEHGEGWMKIKSRIPGTKIEGEKEVFFKTLFFDGKVYIVGSGAYIKN